MPEDKALVRSFSQAIIPFLEGGQELAIADDIILMNINSSLDKEIKSAHELHDIVVAFRVSPSFLRKFGSAVTGEIKEHVSGAAPQGHAINLFGDSHINTIEGNFPSPRFENTSWRLGQAPRSDLFRRVFNIHADTAQDITDTLAYLKEREVITGQDLSSIEKRLAELIEVYETDLQKIGESALREEASGVLKIINRPVRPISEMSAEELLSRAREYADKPRIHKDLHGGDVAAAHKALEIIRELTTKPKPTLGAHTERVKTGTDCKSLPAYPPR